MAYVQPRAHVDLDRLVELCSGETLDERDRLGGGVLSVAIDLLKTLCVATAVSAHEATSTPIERAVPAMIFTASSTSCALRSASLRSAISRNCASVILPTLLRLGSPEPFSNLSGWRMSTAAGGVFVTNVNERSS